MLEIDNIRAGYGRIPILSEISFNVDEHEVLGVLGHNGMGKTTLLKAVIGQVPFGQRRNSLCRGRHHYPTVVSSGARRHRLRAARPPGLSRKSDGLREGLPADGLRRKWGRLEGTIIKDILARFPRLDTLLDRVGGTLSGGEQQQILAVARCLCGSPKLLLLDEPTEGIQPSIIEEILEILIGLHRNQGFAIIVVERNLLSSSAGCLNVYC